MKLGLIEVSIIFQKIMHQKLLPHFLELFSLT